MTPPELADLDGRQLARFLAGPALGLDGLGKGEWLAVAELLTLRLSDDREVFSADDWAAASAAADYVLAAAEAAGAVGHDESVVRRLNLSVAVLRRASPRTDIPILSPDRMAALFAGSVPMSVPQARSLAAGWRNLDIADMRRLRLIRNLVTPMLLVRDLMSEEDGAAEVEQWEEILPLLP